MLHRMVRFESGSLKSLAQSIAKYVPRALGMVSLGSFLGCGMVNHCQPERLPDPCVCYPDAEHYGFYPTCWRRFPDGWGCPCPPEIDALQGNSFEPEDASKAEEVEASPAMDGETRDPAETSPSDSPATSDAPAALGEGDETLQDPTGGASDPGTDGADSTDPSALPSDEPPADPAPDGDAADEGNFPIDAPIGRDSRRPRDATGGRFAGASPETWNSRETEEPSLLPGGDEAFDGSEYGSTAEVPESAAVIIDEGDDEDEGYGEDEVVTDGPEHEFPSSADGGEIVGEAAPEAMAEGEANSESAAEDEYSDEDEAPPLADEFVAEEESIDDESMDEPRTSAEFASQYSNEADRSSSATIVSDEPEETWENEEAAEESVLADDEVGAEASDEFPLDEEAEPAPESRAKFFGWFSREPSKSRRGNGNSSSTRSHGRRQNEVYRKF